MSDTFLICPKCDSTFRFNKQYKCLECLCGAVIILLNPLTPNRCVDCGGKYYPENKKVSARCPACHKLFLKDGRIGRDEETLRKTCYNYRVCAICKESIYMEKEDRVCAGCLDAMTRRWEIRNSRKNGRHSLLLWHLIRSINEDDGNHSKDFQEVGTR